MTAPRAMKMTGASGMVSRVLVISGTTRQSSISVLDAFQLLRKDRLSVKAVFASYLSDSFKKRLGPNTLSHWTKEEEESLARIKGYFARTDVPYDFKIVIVPPWQIIFEEMKDGDHDLIVLQAEFLEKWRNEKGNCALCAEMISKIRRPVFVIDHDGESPD